jgi:hypothetical protein
MYLQKETLVIIIAKDIPLTAVGIKYWKLIPVLTLLKIVLTFSKLAFFSSCGVNYSK